MPGRKVWSVWKWERVFTRKVLADISAILGRKHKERVNLSISAGDRSRRGFPFTMPALLIRIVGVPS